MISLLTPLEHSKEWLLLPSLEKDSNHHVVLYPGLATPAASLVLLHIALQLKGITCHQWEQGFNTGITPAVEEKAEAHLRRLMDANPGAKWHLIGWSLGGLLARELAKTLQEPGYQCESVTTLGTPINALPSNRKVLTIYRFFNKELPTNDIFLEKNLYVSPPVKSLSIYSRQDLVIPWKACIQSQMHKGHSMAINHEVSPGHMAMTNHPKTWSLLVQWIGGTYQPEDSLHQQTAQEEAHQYWTQKQAA